MKPNSNLSSQIHANFCSSCKIWDISVSLPLIECPDASLLVHGLAAVDHALVLSRSRVHEASLEHIDGGSTEGSEEASTDSRQEVAADSVLHQVVAEQGFFDQIVRHKLGAVDDGVTAHIGDGSWNIKRGQG
jgi:hypothetical protein